MIIIDINRWTVSRAQFFAFTTASTIGYGFQAPDTSLGRWCTFLYGLPAIIFFGLAMVNIGSIMYEKIDIKLKQKESKWNQQFEYNNLSKCQKLKLNICIFLGYERKRILVILFLLILVVIIGGAALHRSEGFSFGLHSLLVCNTLCNLTAP